MAWQVPGSLDVTTSGKPSLTTHREVLFLPLHPHALTRGCRHYPHTLPSSPPPVAPPGP